MCVKKFLLITFFSISMGISLFAQILQTFSNSSDNLIQEINTYLSDPKLANQDVINFTSLWNNGSLNETIKEMLTSSFFWMKQKGYKKPDFYKFVNTVNLFFDQNQSDDSFMAWLNYVDELLSQRSFRNFKNFLEQSHNIFTKGLLNKSASIQWIYRNGDFSFFTDSTLKVSFQNGDLLAKSRRDSSVIKETNGVLIPLKNVWEGEGGKLSWQRIGKPEVIAELSDYNINLKLSQYSADSVLFEEGEYFKIPMKGKFTDKIHGSKPTKRTSYPRFNSYQKNYVVDSLLKSIKYYGGLHLQGARFICDSDEKSEAAISFYTDSMPIVEISSNEFVLYEEKISSKRAEVLILFGEDSITHPGVKMRYDDDTRMLELNRRAKGIAPSPFNNSYHKVDMFCDAVYWNMDSLKLDFGSLKGVGKRSEGVFESANYYAAYDYYRLQGIDPVNPLIVIKKYSDIYNTKTVHLGLLSSYIKKPKEQAANLLFNLAERGFVTYNVEEGVAIIKPRLFDFLRAKAGLQDYDVISFKSETENESSATLDLETFDLLLKGIEQVHLSDSQKVQLYPDQKRIRLQKNRNFDFQGMIKGGLLDFGAGKSTFEYDSFKLDMPQIDSLSFKVKKRKEFDTIPDSFIALKSVLSNLSGYMLIDEPTNKSGSGSFPRYPVFHNKNEGYVYYEDSLTMNNQLKKEDFYYFVQPFTIDSLDNFSTDGLSFKGHLISDSIFPTLHEDLVVMNDYSLGFNYKTEVEGLPVYQSKANYIGDIELSNEGLFGKGQLDYLSSSAIADKYLFYPDSLRANAKTFSISNDNPKYDVPDVQAENVDYHWKTNLDHLKVATQDSLMYMFDRQARLDGALDLSPSYLKGKGSFVYENFRLNSNEFDFISDGLSSDTTDFELFTVTNETAFATSNYQTQISFSKRRGDFKSNGEHSELNFPFNSYTSTMDEIEWKMDEDELILRNNLASSIPGIAEMTREQLLDTDLSGSKFISLHPVQDSLSFYSLKARYDMANYILYAEDVKYINVANAAVFPSDGNVTIKQNAEIPTLTGAWIITDIDNRYHSVYNADVNIFSRNNFIAKGSFDYIDANGTPQEIKLNTVSVDSLGITYGLGIVPAEELFFLNPNFFFIGNVKFTSDNPFVRFYGGFRLNQECLFSEPVWVKFDTIVDPANVRLPLTNRLLDLDENRLDVGLFYSVNEGVMYSKVLMSKNDASDRDIAKVRGVVQYNEKDNTFEFGDEAILDGKTFIGNRLDLDLNDCMIRGAGKLQLTDKIDELEYRSYGEYYHDFAKDTTSFRAFFALDFMFDKKVLKIMSDTIQSIPSSKMRMNNDYFKTVMTNASKPEFENDVLYDLEFYAEVRNHLDAYPEKLVITDVFLQWDTKERIYKSKGKIGLGMINGQKINTYVDGLVMIDRKRSNNAVQIYLEINSGLWYYFGYKNKLMQAVSSDTKFNKALSEIDQDKRIIKKDNVIKYEFVISEPQKKNDFLRKYKN